MVSMLIGNSYSRISNLSAQQHKQLRKILSYRVDNYFSGRPPYRVSLLSSKGDFPTGLLPRVEKFNSKYSIKSTINSRPIKPESSINAPKPQLTLTPRPEQNDAANSVRLHNRGIIVMPTGCGKSLVAILMVGNISLPTLIVVPNLGLKQQLTESFIQAYGRENVGNLKENKHIAIDNIDALPLDSKIYSKYKALILDEYHHSAAKTYQKLNKRAWQGIYYRYGLTATPFRTNTEDRLLLESIISGVIYRLSHKEAVAKGYIVPVEAYYIELPRQRTRGQRWAAVYNELVVNNEFRNDRIADILRKLSNFSTLCLVKEIEHGNILSYKSQVDFANGEESNATYLVDRFNAQIIKPLIGTVGVLGEGVDTRPCEYVIVAGLGKARGAFMQWVGRGSRLYPDKTSCKVILFKDSSHKWMLNHFKEQCKILREEYGIEAVQL